VNPDHLPACPGMRWEPCVDGPLDGDFFCVDAARPDFRIHCRVSPAPWPTLVGNEQVNVVVGVYCPPVTRHTVDELRRRVHTYVRCDEGHYHHEGVA